MSKKRRRRTPGPHRTPTETIEPRKPRDHASFVLPGLAIFLIAFAVRLLHLWQMHDTPFFSTLMGDARGYDAWARRIAAGDWVGGEVFYQAPLYPYFLGAIYTVFGRDLMILRICQALLGSLSSVLIGYAGWRLFSRPAGIVAGLMLALYAPAIFFDGLIQKSALDVFFVSAALALIGYVSAAGNRQPATGNDQAMAAAGCRRPVADRIAWIGLGVATGCLALTRENALVLVAVIGAWAFFSRDGRIGRWAAVGLFAFGVAATLVPVAVRNRLVGGGFYLTTSQFGPNFYIGNNPRADGTYASLRFGRGSPEFERTDATEIAERSAGRALTPGEVSSFWTGRALDFIASDPLAWLRLQARKAALLVNAVEMLDTESQEAHAEWSWPLRLLGPAAHFGVLVPLALLGVWATWAERRRLWILYTIALTYALSTVMFFVFARYRYPLVPILILFASAGLVHAREAWQALRRRPGRAALLAGALVLAAVAANWPLLSTTLMRAITETNLGTAFYEDGRLDEAVGRYRRAMAIDPGYAPAYNNLGVTLRAQGRVDEAIRTYRAGLAVHGDYPDLHFNLANALLEQKRPEEAAEHLREAAQGNPDAAGVYNNLGKALAEKGRFDEAATELRKAVALDPQSAKAHRNLGNVLASAGRAPEALFHLQRAVELDGADAEARYDLGSLLLEGGRFEEAARELRAALAVRPDYAEARNNLGIALASQGRIAEAITQWEAALRVKPDFADARRNLEKARSKVP
jgi:tetratricopeptide (TPR) repeat protein